MQLDITILATGESFRFQEFQFRIGRKIISGTAMDVTTTMDKELS